MKTFIECQSCQSSNGPRLIDIGNDNNSRINRTNNINDDQDVSLIRIIDHQHQFSDEWSANNYENSSNININNNNNSNTSSTKISDIFAEILHHPIPLSSIFTFNNIINIIINPSNLSKKKLNHHYNTLLIILWILISLLLLMAKHIQCYDDNFNDDLDQTFTSICESNGGINAIGMESGMIPDSALSASSSYNEQSVGPQNARLNRELYGGAWCPSTQINQTNSGHEWIQINLTETYVITKIATQGRFGNGMGVEYAEIFWLNYTRDGVRWTRWSNMNGEFDIQGNMDTYSIVENVLTIPLVAITAIRLLPVSSYTRTCCLRLEIYGCPYKDGPISYSMIDGQLNGRFGDLIDHTYDGYRSETGFLSDGLGQLTDGIRGDDNYKVNKGFEWIGWKANTQSVVSITFRFADIRNFTSATFHCHNMFTKDIQVFHSAQIWFSLDGRQWSSMPEDFAYMPDMVFEKARDVIIHLHHRIGRFIKFDFRFAAKWLLISEATFDSNAVNGGLSINELDFVDSRPITKSLLNANNNIQTSSSINTQINRHNSNNNNDSYNSLYREPFFLIGFTIMIVLLITIFIIMLIWFTQKRKEKITGSEYTTVPMKDVSPSAIYCEPNGFANHHHHHLTFPNVSVTADPEYAVPDLLGGGGVGGGGSNGPSSTFMTTNKANNNLLFINNYRQQQQPLISSFANKTMMMANNPDDGKARYYAATDVLVRNGGNNYPTSNIIAINRNGNSPLSLAPLPASQVYPTKHDSTPSSSLSSSNTSKVLKNNNSSTPSTALEIYENTPITSNGSSLSNSMAPLLKDKEISIIDGHFGYSKYGDCELGYLNRSKNDKQLVFLKTLSSNQNTKLQKEFVAEMNEKWRLSNQCPKIFAKLFGYISKYDYLAMVIECGDMDLKRFLSNSSSQIIRMEQLLEISRQIAKAMQELHENSFIHRDLAARNCLIYPKNFQIKISDIGSSNNEYKNEYYQQCFPIRWMSYEAIIESKFTTKSDVYSFGVTLWEIMNYCQSLPHHFLSDEELLTHVYNYENLDKVYDTSSSTSSTAFYNHPFTNNDNINELTKYNLLQLPKPKDCSNDIYDLIIECTQYMADSRPEFEEIVNFIQTKNLAL